MKYQILSKKREKLCKRRVKRVANPVQAAVKVLNDPTRAKRKKKRRRIKKIKRTRRKRRRRRKRKKMSQTRRKIRSLIFQKNSWNNEEKIVK